MCESVPPGVGGYQGQASSSRPGVVSTWSPAEEFSAFQRPREQGRLGPGLFGHEVSLQIIFLAPRDSAMQCAAGRLVCTGRSAGSGHLRASANSLQLSPRGPGFLLSVPRGLPRPGYTPLLGLRSGWEAGAELAGWAALGTMRPPSQKVCEQRVGPRGWEARLGTPSLLGRLQGAL